MNRRRLLSVPFAVLIVLAAVAPAYGYNGENKLHVRMSQPQHTDCGEPAPLTANVADHKGNPAPPGTRVDFFKHHGYAGEALVPTFDFTDASGNAESTYTIPCGSKPGARVIKACEPAGGCGTTVVVCRPKDGCTGTGNAGGGIIVAKAGDSGHTAADASAPLVAAPPRDTVIAAAAPVPANTPTSGTLPPLLNLLSIAILGMVAAGITRGRPKAFRAATPA